MWILILVSAVSLSRFGMAREIERTDRIVYSFRCQEARRLDNRGLTSSLKDRDNSMQWHGIGMQ